MEMQEICYHVAIVLIKMDRCNQTNKFKTIYETRGEIFNGINHWDEKLPGEKKNSDIMKKVLIFFLAISFFRFQIVFYMNII